MINGENWSGVDCTPLLLRLSRIFNSSLDLDHVLSCVMDEVVRTLHAERGFIMLRGADGESKYYAARGISLEAITDPCSEISLEIVQQVASTGYTTLTSNGLPDAGFNQHRCVNFSGLRSILCVPLLVKAKHIGVIYLDNRLVVGVFTPQDLELLSAIASIAAVAIENARLYQEAVEKGRR